MALSENTKETIKYYRLSHEGRTAWDDALLELKYNNERHNFLKLTMDLLQSMNGVFMVDYESDVTSVVGK